MKVSFHKYHGTGNDFIIIDNRKLLFQLRTEDISKLCNRRLGIGADGLVLLQDADGYDFEMIYFNADGNESTMCGNGGRCIVDFAQKLGIINNRATFLAIDGLHEAVVKGELINLKMRDVNNIEITPEYCFMDTGSPHYLLFVNNINDIDVVNEGRKIRYNARFNKEGTNVNFIEEKTDHIYVRTYERGVENETLSCGTGMVAAALYASLKGVSGDAHFCNVATQGGKSMVSFRKNNKNEFTEIWLEAPAVFIFKGDIIV